MDRKYSESEKEFLEQGYGLKSFILPNELDNQQLIVARKKIDRNHYVFTHGMKETDKLRCFRLQMVDDDEKEFDAFEYTDWRDIAKVVKLMGLDKPRDEQGKGDVQQ